MHISRRHVLVEPLSLGEVRLTNTSNVNPLVLPDGGIVGPGKTRDLPLPAMLGLGHKTVRIEASEGDPLLVRGLEELATAPGQYFSVARRLPALERPTGGVEVESLLRWLQTIVGVLQTAASSRDFFQCAVQAVVDVVGLDVGRVLILEDTAWRTEAERFATSDKDTASPARPSRKVLARLLQEKRTFWIEPDQTGLEEATL